jgi:hypothetical protein
MVSRNAGFSHDPGGDADGFVANSKRSAERGKGDRCISKGP